MQTESPPSQERRVAGRRVCGKDTTHLFVRSTTKFLSKKKMRSPRGERGESRLAEERFLRRHKMQAPALWMEESGGVRVCKVRFRYVGLETAMGESLEDVPKHVRAPEEFDLWKWRRAGHLCVAARKKWYWYDGKPKCEAREAAWRRVRDDKDELSSAPKKKRFSFMSLFDEKKQRELRELQLEVALSRLEWSSIYRRMPFENVADLDAALSKISSADAFASFDSIYGGNLLWHAARVGDDIACRRLLQKGNGHLAREPAQFDGRTAFEIALTSGFPDTAFLLEPYARLRNADQKKHMDHLLKRELDFLCQAPDRQLHQQQ